jgi:hypothetical protein
MAIGCMAILNVVPWCEVARKAPEIAESAKKIMEQGSPKINTARFRNAYGAFLLKRCKRF